MEGKNWTMHQLIWIDIVNTCKIHVDTYNIYIYHVYKCIHLHHMIHILQILYTLQSSNGYAFTLVPGEEFSFIQRTWTVGMPTWHRMPEENQR